MRHLIPFALSIILLAACTNRQSEKEVTSTLDSAIIEQHSTKLDPDGLSQQDSIKATGRQILTFLKQRNYPELVKYFSAKGVRFVPYSFIDSASSKLLTSESFLQSIDKKWILTWGSYDGTGDPIKLTVAAYLKKFVYNADYLNAEATAFDALMKQGSSINNIKDIYPNHHYIDYHFSGFDQKYAGMDWTSLRLVFEKNDGQYFVVAIIHDQWTI